MNHQDHSSWKLIEGFHATRYMLIMVVSMSITVTFTRVYLEVTGYPQLGNGTFHIAHALWGGLLLAIAAGLMLIYLNQWIFSLSSVFAGMGMGLFVDEIGKFITQSNDYFFPLAAPLIYITIILGVFLYLYIRQEDKHDARGEMYIVLEGLKPLLDERMDAPQYENLRAQLNRLASQTERSDIADIAQALLQSIPQDASALPVLNQGLFSRAIAFGKQIEANYFRRSFIRRILMLFFGISGWASLTLVLSLALILTNHDVLETLILTGVLENDSLIKSPTSINWYIALIVVTISAGILYWVALVAFIRRREHFATQIGIIGLVLSLTIGNTMSFYFSQFSVMLSTLLSFGLLLIVIRYRDRFLQEVEQEH